MPEIGQTLSHFRLVDKIGQGGMGEVYLADDTTLDRKVALKFLPEMFTSDPERMSRFEREAKLLASLNHPNIAGIYGLEQADGNRFLVLEYVEGETLQARLSKGALPLEDALELCRQIAEGLEAAHEKGVIHRDLKPANVMITAEEKVKILDFGLAKVFSDDTQSIDSSQSPTLTLTDTMTRPGVILGTAAYMSPEQAKGKGVDKRADIWAFGCILYECLTGKKAFAGETATEMLAAILRGEPDWDALPHNTLQNIRFLLRRCLEKEKGRRFKDAADVQIEIEEARDNGTAIEPVNQQHSRIAWSIAVACFIGAIVLGYLYLRQNPEREQELLLEVNTPTTLEPTSFAISPDGLHLAFVASAEERQMLWHRPLNQLAAQPLLGTEGALYPFWSPDSQSIGFFAGGKLKRIDIAGGIPMVLADAPSGQGGAWNREGDIIFAPTQVSPLFRVPASGAGKVTVITQLDPPFQKSHTFPQFLPDGKHLLYAATGTDEGIYLGSLNSTDAGRLILPDLMGTYASAGYLLFLRQNTLFARRFDFKKGELVGDEIRIADSVLKHYYALRGGFSVSETGVLAYRTTDERPLRQLAWFDRSGNEVGTLGEPDEDLPESPELSPDGDYVAINRRILEVVDIYLLETGRRGAFSQFTHESGAAAFYIWSPDSNRIVFGANRKGIWDLYQKSLSDAEDEELYVDPSVDIWPNDWSTDGQYILYLAKDPTSGRDLCVLPMSGDERAPYPIVNTSFEEQNGQFSPNGRLIAYESNESGRFEVYIQPFKSSGRKHKVSIDGGIEPRWHPEGKELFYIAPDGKLMAALIQGDGQTLSVGIPAPLFQTQIVGGGNVKIAKTQYDVSCDGRRFLINITDDKSASAPIIINTNWTRALKK
jgi:serine/threonine protein kinase